MLLVISACELKDGMENPAVIPANNIKLTGADSDKFNPDVLRSNEPGSEQISLDSTIEVVLSTEAVFVESFTVRGNIDIY